MVDFDHHSAEFNADADAAWGSCGDLPGRLVGAPRRLLDRQRLRGQPRGVEEPRGVHHRTGGRRRRRGSSSRRRPGSPRRPLPLEVDPPATPRAPAAERGAVTDGVEGVAATGRPLDTHFIDSVIEAGECDLLYDITSPVPAYVILEWLGYPLEHAGRRRSSTTCWATRRSEGWQRPFERLAGRARSWRDHRGSSGGAPRRRDQLVRDPGARRRAGRRRDDRGARHRARRGRGRHHDRADLERARPPQP